MMLSDISPEERASAERLAERIWRQKRVSLADPSAPWHMVLSVARSDQRVIDWLTELNIEFYYPQMWEMRPVPKRALSKRQRALGIEIQKPRLVPFLPSYWFVRINLGQAGWRETFKFVGIAGLAYNGSLPVAVNDSVIEDLRGREVDGAIPGATPAGSIFRVGESVRITDGALKDRNATVVILPDVAIQDIDANTRIRVAVDFFGGSTLANVTIGQIAKL